MGRKAKATKNPSIKEPLVPNSPTAPNQPVEEQASATDGNPKNLEFSPVLSDTSRSGKKKSKTATAIVRRSQRLQPTAGNQELGPVVHEVPINQSENAKQVSENEKEDELHKSPEETSDETDRNSDKKNPDVGDLKYKAMYFNSQKKLEALMEENKELNKALEHAIGKIDVFEKQSGIFLGAMDIFGSLSRTNENLSAQFKRSHCFYNSEDGARACKRNRTGQSDRCRDAGEF